MKSTARRVAEPLAADDAPMEAVPQKRRKASAAGRAPLRLVAAGRQIRRREKGGAASQASEAKVIAASRAKDDFLAALSLELRTPLNPVLLLATEGANNPQLPAAARADFAAIAKYVTLEAQLIDDMLDLTQSADGKVARSKNARPASDLARSAAPPLPGARKRPYPILLRRILLVEDHQPTALVLRHLLTRRNYVVAAVASLAEARAVASRENFELLISDIGLPDGDGYELLAELHGRHGLVGIALTGYGMEEDVSRSQAAGFVAHLTKPITVEALDSALSAANDRLNA